MVDKPGSQTVYRQLHSCGERTGSVMNVCKQREKTRLFTVPASPAAAGTASPNMAAEERGLSRPTVQGVNARGLERGLEMPSDASS